MDTITETNAAVQENRTQSVRQAYDGAPVGRPQPEWVRGLCPACGEEVISNCYYIGGRGYKVIWECWASLGELPTCSYRKVL